MLQSYSDLNDMHIDALREIGNIGAGNAAASLAMMLADQIDISVPTVRILEYERVMEELGGPEQMIVGLLLCLEGDVNGMIMFLLHQEFANRLLKEEKVAVVPGTAFGDCGEGFLRISYAYSLENLKIALDKIKAFISRLREEK